MASEDEEISREQAGSDSGRTASPTTDCCWSEINQLAAPHLQTTKEEKDGEAMMLTRQVENKRPRHAHIFARDGNDRYIEPQWCSRRLLEEESFVGTIHDPAAGTGRILTSARAA